MSGAQRSDTAETLSRSVDQMLAVQRDIANGLLSLLSSGGGTLTKLLRGKDDCCAQPRFGMTSLTGSCCEIPEPCWMPRCVGEFECSLCPGSSATLKLHVTNEDLASRQLQALASGAGAKQVSFSPQSLALGPKERGTLHAHFAVPGEARHGDEFHAIVWLRGCRDYYVRWTVKAGHGSGCCRHDLTICDGPDHVLHWYDHFYCPRPCADQRRQAG
jgi:hypothetical protein